MWDHIRDEPRALEQAQKFEPVEIAGIVSYLMARSQPMMGGVERAEGVSAPDVERGKLAFETRGCLACHQHSAFDDANHAGPRFADGASDLFHSFLFSVAYTY